MAIATIISRAYQSLGVILALAQFKNMEYFVTVQISKIPTESPILMVDGTVPGWRAKLGDLHFDHHRPGGAPVQIGEMPLPMDLGKAGVETIVTCQVDADAQVAAAAAQLSEEELTSDVFDRLSAIAWDCDHLCVAPPRLAHLSKFAAEAVAALKASSDPLASDLGLPENRKAWSEEDKEIFASLAFQQGTEWLLAAARGQRPWPGESGEAKEYWAQLERDVKKIATQGRISYPAGIALIDMRGFFAPGEDLRYVDPRAALKAVDVGQMRLPATLTVRDVWVNGEKLGLSYTIGCHPSHGGWESLDYSKAKTFDLLSEREISLCPTELDVAFSDLKWGGRATVGGSPWKCPSRLQPQEVANLIKQSLTTGS